MVHPNHFETVSCSHTFRFSKIIRRDRVTRSSRTVRHTAVDDWELVTDHDVATGIPDTDEKATPLRRIDVGQVLANARYDGARDLHRLAEQSSGLREISRAAVRSDYDDHGWPGVVRQMSRYDLLRRHDGRTS